MLNMNIQHSWGALGHAAEYTCGCTKTCRHILRLVIVEWSISFRSNGEMILEDELSLLVKNNALSRPLVWI